MEKLEINGVLYARYEIEKNPEGYRIYIKCLNPELFEDVLISLISKIEQVEIASASFLNVDLQSGL